MPPTQTFMSMGLDKIKRYQKDISVTCKLSSYTLGREGTNSILSRYFPPVNNLTIFMALIKIVTSPKPWWKNYSEVCLIA